MIAAATAPEVQEEWEARQAAERAREAAKKYTSVARAEAERLAVSEAKMREAAADRDKEHPNLLQASKEASDRAAAAEAELLAYQQRAGADAPASEVGLAGSQAGVGPLDGPRDGGCADCRVAGGGRSGHGSLLLPLPSLFREA